MSDRSSGPIFSIVLIVAIMVLGGVYYYVTYLN